MHTKCEEEFEDQNPYIEEEETTQRSKEKGQMDKQRFTKHTCKSKRTPQKNGGELRCSGRVSTSCSTSDTLRVNLVTNPVISRECIILVTRRVH